MLRPQRRRQLAWTASGDAPTDLLFIPGFISHVEHLWEQPGLAGFFERLMGFSRPARSWTGAAAACRTRATVPLALEDEARDVLAVLDAAGSERAVLMGYTTGGLLAVATAALAPERVQAVVLYASMARAIANDDVDWTYDAVGRRAMWAGLAAGVGHGRQPRADRALARRRPADEGVAGAHGAPVVEPGRCWPLMNFDGRPRLAHLLGALRVPTLIVHRTGDRLIDARHSRFLAERIPGARLSSSRASTTCRAP